MWNKVTRKLPEHEEIIVAYINGHIPEICIFHKSQFDYLFLDKGMKQILGIQYWCALPLWPDLDNASKVIVSDTPATEAGKKVMDKYAKAINNLGDR